jgi:hypothetical protein
MTGARDRQLNDAALVTCVVFMVCVLGLNWLVTSHAFSDYAWPNVVRNQHCRPTPQIEGQRRIYECDDGYRQEGALYTDAFMK